jgi:hypothetical protein
MLHRASVFEMRVLRRICGPKRAEETEGWRKVHNEEIHLEHLGKD